MNKTNIKEILKHIIGVLLFGYVCIAEAVSTGCKKLRTLPQKVMAVCLAVAMIAALLPGNLLMVASAETDSGLPGARVETNDYGDVFLGGNYIEMGISKHGSFGTSTSPQTSGWHKQSDLSGIGFRSDEDGWDVGEEPLTGDFFLPGSAEERWILSYKADGEKYEQLIADRYQGNIGSWLEEPKTVNASDLGRGILKAVVTGTTAKNVKIEITYSFGVNDLFYTTDVKVTNLGDADIEDVRFVRSFDPDQDQDNYSTYSTYNKVICNPDATKPGGDNNYALVVARGVESLASYFFLTFDNRARASRGVAFAPSSAYLEGLWDTAPVTEKTYATEADIEITSENRNGYTYEDSAIALTFNISTLSAADSTELQYYSSLDPDVMSSLKNVLAGNVDYTEEVLTGLYAGASYQITYDGVTYIFKNIPESMVPLVGTAPTTADPTSAVAYDFLGKTITVVEVNELGETVSEEQELTIASRPGEVQPGEILPDVPAPVIENITTTLDSITIDPAVAIQEYSLDRKIWISPTDGKVSFIGLEDGTGYTVYTRVAATSEYPASQVISILVYTDAYKVTLNYGTLGRKEVYAQASGKLNLPHPVFDGYIFMGWYDNAEFTTPHDFTIGVEGDVTLYAKFADYEGDKEALQGAINAAKTDLQTKIDAVNSALANKASTADLTNAVNDLNTAIENAKAYADTQDTALKAAIEGAGSVLNTAIDALKDRVTAIENQLNGIDLSQIAAIKTAIETLTTELGAVKTTVDQLDNTFVNNTEFSTAIANLKTELEDADDALEALLTALDGRVDDIEDALNGIDLSQIATNKTSIATLTGELGDLNTLVNTIKTNYITADTNLQTQITALDTKLTDLIDETFAELTDSVNQLKNDLNTANGKINTNASDVGTLKTDVSTLKTWKDNAQSAIEALQTLTGTQGTNISVLQTAVANLQTAVNTANDKITAVENRIADLEGKVSALETAKTNLDNAITALQTAVAGKADAATVNAAIAELQAAIDALEAVKNNYIGADDALRTDLEGKIATAKGEAISAAETLVNNAKVELTAAINNKADTATLNAKISELNTAIATAEATAKAYTDGAAAALTTAIATAKSEAITAAEKLVNTAKAELQNAINSKADIGTFNTKVSELNAAIETAEATAKAYTDSAATTLNAAIITAKDEAVNAAKDLVNTAKAELQAAIDNKADTATVNVAIANLQNTITALQNAKDNYIAADAVLKAELEETIAKAKQEAIDAAKGYIPYIGTNGNWWIGDTDTGVDANGIKGDTGADGVGIAKIEKTATNGNVDTYTVTLTNGKTYTFTVTNGKDGLTPFIGENGNWWIGDTDTGVKAAADDSIPVGSGNVTEAEGVNTVTVVAIVIASLALLGNVLLAVLVLKKKKSFV